MTLLLACVVAAASPTLQVDVRPKGTATVHVTADWGAVAGSSGVPIEVKSGTAVVRVTRTGYWDAWATVHVKKSGHTRVRVVQNAGVPLDEFPLSGQVGFSISGSWKRSDKTPWKVAGSEIVMSGELPGTTSNGSVGLPLADSYVISCQVYRANLRTFNVFGQQIVKNGWTNVSILVVGKKEYLSTGGAFKKASTVTTGFGASYTPGVAGEARIRHLQFKVLSDKELKYLRRIYRL